MTVGDDLKFFWYRLLVDIEVSRVVVGVLNYKWSSKCTFQTGLGVSCKNEGRVSHQLMEQSLFLSGHCCIAAKKLH